MAITPIASVGLNSNAALGNQTTTPIDTTGATLVVIIASYYNGNGPPLYSDSNGNTYTSRGRFVGQGNNQCDVLDCVNPVVGPGHTFTFETFSPFETCYEVMTVLTFDGTDAGAFDQILSAITTGGNTAQSGSLTPSQANSLLLSALSIGTIAPGFGGDTIDSGFTIEFQEGTSGVTDGLEVAQLIQTTALPSNPTWTSGTTTYGTLQVIYQPASGGNTVSPSGIASVAAVGDPTIISSGHIVSPTGIASVAAVGDPFIRLQLGLLRLGWQAVQQMIVSRGKVRS